ncbi:hypothetical protein D3878_10240 [Noviherbaspirillum sedimenti]|uniref:Uncharacterized protein n=2 Tax=Noviherbaspirillum sedimenti TaxID=2320865 RepID=A0A3A3G1V8_9BURK|nr:hypothetical protein D3878_10240 [Noviherbaspirillum sedimenti]
MAIACLFLAGCGGASISLLFFDDLPQDHVQVLPFQKISPTFDSAIGAQRLVVIRDIVAWDALWREHTAGILPSPPLPPINFSQNMVIGVFLGRGSNACKDVKIESILEHTRPHRIEVNFREILASNSTCATGLRNPSTLVVLTYSFLPVEFFQKNPMQIL